MVSVGSVESNCMNHSFCYLVKSLNTFNYSLKVETVFVDYDSVASLLCVMQSLVLVFELLFLSLFMPTLSRCIYYYKNCFIFLLVLVVLGTKCLLEILFERGTTSADRKILPLILVLVI